MSNQQMYLHLLRVICGDETGGSFVERVGNDEIWLSGIGLDATGTVFKLDPFEVYANFDDGEKKEYDPPKTLFTLAVPDDGAFPKVCGATLILCERADGAGHLAVTQQALTKLTEQVAAAKADGGASAIASIAWEVVKVEVRNYVKELIDSGLNDNVFPPQEASVSISSSDFFWGDGTKMGPTEQVQFRAFQGVYYLEYFWQIETVA